MRVGRRGVVVLLALADVGLAMAVVLVVGRPTGPVYTVDQVVAGLAHNPRAWLGRTITVRGTLAVVMYDDSGTPGGGVGSGFCWPRGTCIMGLPTDTARHIFLVGPTPRGIPAYAGMLGALLAARAPQSPATPLLLGTPVHVWRTVPPVLVVLVPPHRMSPTWAHIARAAQQAASTLPNGSWRTLAQLPLVGPFFEQLLMPGRVHGGTPRLYRVRLLPPVPPARRTSCDAACDDAVLLDNLH